MMKTREFLYKSIGRIIQMLPIKQFTDLTALGHSMQAWKHEPRQIFQLSHKIHGRDEKSVCDILHDLRDDQFSFIIVQIMK
jgi:hypothetical protein